MESNFRGVMPQERLASLRRMLEEKKFVRILEAHNGLTGRIVETASAEGPDGETVSYDGMWVSSLCDSTAKGKPDIELVDFSSRRETLEQILEVTTKPIILDGDTGGKTEHLVYNVRTLERLGISAIIIEDKIGLKKNSLFGTAAAQQQDSPEHFCEKIAAVKAAQMTREFMCFARCESLILKQGMDDALRRTAAYVAAGADGIMIHSKEKDPAEIVEYLRLFKADHPDTPVVVVPTSYNTITEAELKSYGVNVVIYANHLLRSAYPAMMKTAQSILAHQRAAEADADYCMSIKEILTLIPDRL